MQDTRDITLPTSKKPVVVKGYITGQIDQEVRKITLAGNKSHIEKEVDPNAPDGQIDDGPMKMVMDTDPTVQIDADNKLIELMVLSLDGETDKILDAVLLLPKDDVDFLLKEIKGVESASKVEAADPKAPQS